MYHKIANSFNRAASNYDDHAALQRHVGKILIDKLKCMKIKPKSILDLGCGTGFMMREIHKIWPEVKVVNVDMALLMCQKTQTNAVCMLAQSLAIKEHSFDIVISNLMLQWLVDDISVVANEVCRVLKPKGIFLFSTFGPDTLCELKDLANNSVNDQLDMHILGDVLAQANFVDVVMDRLPLQLEYNTLKEMLWDIRGVGANVVLSENSTKLNKSSYQAIVQNFEKKYGAYLATYEVVFGLGYVPERLSNEVLLSEINRS